MQDDPARGRKPPLASRSHRHRTWLKAYSRLHLEWRLPAPGVPRGAGEPAAQAPVLVASQVPNPARDARQVELRTSGVADGTAGWQAVKRLLIGQPLATWEAAGERLSKVRALAVLSSDALSSVAYATEETLLVLATAGSAALALSLPIAGAIVLLLALITISYRQTIFAYPSGGGSYIVASANLGRLAGLTAAAALLIDYVLTVSVSVASGVAALTSAAPALADHTVAIGLGCIVVIALVNLRGMRDSSAIFAAPTYAFLTAILATIGIGLYRVLVLHDPLAAAAARDPVPGAQQALALLLVLRAFSSGCSAMTGVEAISNGVPVFRPDPARNAAATMVWMSGLLGVMFLGITYLAHAYGLVPRPTETILSQLGHLTLGTGWLYYALQAVTLLILVLAANTSFADFPRLASILARDGFLPTQFSFRGDRLAFSVGIIFLACFSAGLLVLFHGNTTALIPLYAVGVFVSFTLSQAGMVRHWLTRPAGASFGKAAINGLGAAATGMVAVIAGGTKLMSGEPLLTVAGYQVRAGSWIVLALIPLLILMFQFIRRHYDRAAADEAPETPVDPAQIHHKVVVPIARLRIITFQALAYAKAISSDVLAVHVAEDEEGLERFRQLWSAATRTHPYLSAVPLVLILSPYRSLIAPILGLLDDLRRKSPDDTITVVVPELVPVRWWEPFLHNQVAKRLRSALAVRPGIVVSEVPYHIRPKGGTAP